MANPFSTVPFLKSSFKGKPKVVTGKRIQKEINDYLDFPYKFT
jgi:hypothetical protein